MRLELEPGASRAFDVNGASQVRIADPAVADVLVSDQTQTLTLLGAGTGETQLSVTIEGRTQSWVVSVHPAKAGPRQALSLFDGEARLMTVPRLVRVAIADPLLVDVQPAGSDQLLFTAHRLGQTNVHVWTSDARRLEYVVTVTNKDPAPSPSVLDLKLGLQRVLSFPGLAGATVIHPDVCEVSQLSAQELRLLPRAVGKTGVVVVSANGHHQVLSVIVRPGSPPSH